MRWQNNLTMELPGNLSALNKNGLLLPLPSLQSANTLDLLKSNEATLGMVTYTYTPAPQRQGLLQVCEQPRLHS